MNPHFPRHCERSEAIHPGLPRHLRLLAMTLVACSAMALWASPSYAMSQCEEKYTFENNLESAGIVFEGHLEKMSLYKDIEKNKKNTNINNSVSYFLTNTWIVDKAWKGVSVGEKITEFVGMPMTNRDMSYIQNKIPDLQKKLKEQGGGIILFNTNKPKLHDMYSSLECDSGHYPPDEKHISLLNKKFPAATHQ